MKAKSAILIAVVLGGATGVNAWESGGDDSVTSGPQHAQFYRAPTSQHDEHARLLVDALMLSGLPPAFVSEDLGESLEIFSVSEPVDGIPLLNSVIPVPFHEAEDSDIRFYSLPMMAQLPDHSYAIWDWAAGNELCPEAGIPPVTDSGSGPVRSIQCHSFKTHMGTVNSNHFPPQSQTTYTYYHNLAMERAGQCAEFSTSIGQDFDAAFVDFVQECEWEALAFETFGQHFLQDAWAIGHMWQRWGSSDFGGFTGGPLLMGPQVQATVVAIMSGIIHGAQSITGIPDNLSSALSEDVRWVSGSDGPLPGVGDLWEREMPVEQRARLMVCSIAGLREVYAATGRVHGQMGDSPVTFPSNMTEFPDPTSGTCFGQRVTNAALWAGFDIKIGGSESVGSADVAVFAAVNRVGMIVSPVEAAVLKFELARLAAGVKIRSDLFPNRTDLADPIPEDDGNPMHRFLLAERNGHAANNIVAPYVDSRFDERYEYVERVFHKAHSANWCSAAESDPNLLRNSGSPACPTMAARHIRIGNRPSLCDALLGADPNPILFPDTSVHLLTSSYTDRGETWCSPEAPRPGDIAFTAVTTDPMTPAEINTDVHIVREDGTNLARLTFAPGRDNGASVSLDGSLVAFGSNRSESSSIYVMGVDRSNLTELAEGDDPALSWDGSKIVFTVDPDGPFEADEPFELWAINVDGSGLQLIEQDAFAARWSPDGTRIAFASSRDSEVASMAAIYVKSLDGSSSTQQITQSLSLAGGPAWSPDGKKIAFHRRDASGFGEIQVMNSDGTNVQTLGPGNRPSWSPDGTKIAFDHNPGGGTAMYLYVMNADGSNVSLIGDGFDPSWTP